VGSTAGEMDCQLEVKNIIMAEGRINIIDAMPIEAAQSDPGENKDGEAIRRWQAGMLRMIVVGVQNPPMGIRFMPGSMKMGLFIVKVSRRAMFMTARNETRYCWNIRKKRFLIFRFEALLNRNSRLLRRFIPKWNLTSSPP